MGLLIDSSVLIAAERGHLDLAERAQNSEADLAIAAVTATELLHGVHRANTEARQLERSSWVEALLWRIPVVSFDLVAARVHARIWAETAKRGVQIGSHDLLIGASALSRGLLLVTRDKRSFERIPGLEVEYW